MYDVIIAFPKIEDAKSIKNILIQNGIGVNAVVNSASQAIAAVNELDGGILICGWRFRDMYYKELRDYLPDSFSMLLIASASRLSDVTGDIVCLSLPFKTYDLINTVQMMIKDYRKRKKKKKTMPSRTEEEIKSIEKAKTLLMERNNLSEEEAHRYLQKTSMDNGTNMAETAQMLLSMM